MVILNGANRRTRVTITGRNPATVPPAQATGSYTQAAVTVGGGVPVNITHNLNTSIPDVTTIRTSDSRRVLIDIVVIDPNTIALNKNGPNITVDVLVIGNVII